MNLQFRKKRIFPLRLDFAIANLYHTILSQNYELNAIMMTE